MPHLTSIQSPNRSTKVLLVLDVVESVRLMEQDQDDFVRRWQELVRRTEQMLPTYGGHIVKSLGDGLMLKFAHAQDCIRAAFALQQCSQKANTGWRSSQQIHLRMGGHLACFVADQHDIYGTDVNLTSRLCTLGNTGDIMISEALHNKLVHSIDASFEDMGEIHLKHIERPVRVWRASPPCRAPAPAPRPEREKVRPTVAVIPFTARSAGPNDALMGDILADGLVAALSRVPELDVVSRTCADTGRSHVQGMPLLQSQLNVNYVVLSAAYRVGGNQLVLVTELIETRSGRAVCDNLRSTLHDILKGEEKVISELVSQLWVQIMRAEQQRTADTRASRPVTSPAAVLPTALPTALPMTAQALVAPLIDAAVMASAPTTTDFHPLPAQA